MGQASSKSIGNTINLTHFDKKEISNLENIFYNEKNLKSVSRNDLRIIYSKYFPFGDPSLFVDLVFRLFSNSSNDNNIGFSSLIQAWSIVSRGNLDERIKWSFKFHDYDQDGRINRDDVTTILNACIQITRGVAASLNGFDTKVDEIFDIFQARDSQMIDFDLFSNTIRTNPDILKGFLLFDGLL
jgi:Ca2+-binding EF-hand superfamily protein